MKNEENRKYIKYMLTGFGSISLSILFFFLLFRLSGIGTALNTLATTLRPVIIGAALAYLLHPVCNSFERWFQQLLPKKLQKAANGLAVTVTTILTLLVLYVLIILIVPQVYNSIISLQHTLPRQAASLVAQLKEMFADNPSVLAMVDQLYESLQSILNNFVSDYVMPNLSLIMNSVGIGVNIVKDVVIGFIAAVYLMAARKTLLRQSKMIIHAIFSRKWATLILKETIYADRKFGGFISGKLIDSLIIGILCYFFSLIFKFPSALLISVIVGVTNIIPFFGPFIGAIPSALLILIQEPVKALWFGLFILVLQQVDGNIIGPRILGNTTGLSSFWVLFSILLFGGIFGFMGMIVGVPLFAVIYDIIRSLVLIGLKKHGVEPSEAYKPVSGA